MVFDTTEGCILIDSVSARRCKDRKDVSKEFSRFMDDLFVTVCSGSTVTIAGFGRFWMQSGSLRFSRLTMRIEKPVLNVKNTAPDNMYYVNNLNISDDWPWHNTIRTRHLDGDPLYMTVFVEANRRIYFKGYSMYCYYWNRPVLLIDHAHSSFYNNDRFKQHMECLAGKRKKNMDRLRLWVPRLVSLLLSKTNTVDDARGHL